MTDKKEKTLWASPESNPRLTVRQVGKYYYAERLGRDSVAFILYDKKKYPRLGLIQEYKSPLGKDLITAFGGTLDKNISIKNIVLEEVQEESGYVVDLSRIHLIGKRYVSTQMNQYCYLFLVDVTDLKPGPRNPQDELEEQAKVVWLDLNKILKGPCWKAQVIVQNFSKLGIS